ncbi:galactonate dehydratase [Allonocardiopsis opalescens]|uniref:Galactonate dehydratase n=1 Tax=Allonocardiopsis opalescens TaxID=1144618 RepID=A0A2T0QFB0_9ACTN|nr:galactonate dehydratase [Allonocardiopsis opalescens]PRY02570.1 galactonate dehydratase [Allonocardiopsis opalescens]
MRITRIETFLVAPRWLFCRVETDEGLVGWGEPVLEGRALTVRTAVEELAPLLIGRDPLRVEDLWQVMTKSTFYRGGGILSSAVAGIDQALWDIAGKARGVPVHELFGGPVRDRVRFYSWVGGDEPAEIADRVAAQVEAGATAVKMNAIGRKRAVASNAELDAVIARAAEARSVLGPERDFALDFHGRMSIIDCRRLFPWLAPLSPLFVEEPLVPELGHLLPQLAEHGVPIATGERLFGRHEFLPAFTAGISVAQPDISHAGGISEVRRIASMADVWGVQIAPHCPLGPIALASSLQVGFSTHNFLVQEVSAGIHYNAGADLLDYLVDTSVFRTEDGHIPRLTGPGLGIEIDEGAVRAADARGFTWTPPVWRDDDGAHAEW